MKTEELKSTAQSLMTEGKGILAMDESNPTCNRRFADLGIPQTKEARLEYRRMIVTSPGLGNSISGAILFDETIHESLSDEETIVEALQRIGIIPGIKVDRGTIDMVGFPGEKITEGLDGLFDRVHRFQRMGARFAKWRAVVNIDKGLPTPACVAANAYALARYAAICQFAGLVPVVEPEVIFGQSDDIEQVAEVTEHVLHSVFSELIAQRVALEAMILKPNMVTTGKGSASEHDNEQVADITVRTLMRAVPAAVAGIAFLSGGQPGKLATARLNAMNVRFASKTPWPLSFSFARAIQQEALKTWAGKVENADAAQKILVHRARCNSAARRGQYSSKIEAELSDRPTGSEVITSITAA